MLGSLFRAVLILVIVVAIVVGVGAFLMGYRASGGRGRSEPAAVATSGQGTTAREKGAEIGERVGAAADRAGEILSDGALTAKIKSKFALDDTLKSSEIHVSTTDKVVTLTGRADSSAQRDRAAQLARETAGVKSVTDHLRVGR